MTQVELLDDLMDQVTAFARSQGKDGDDFFDINAFIEHWSPGKTELEVTFAKTVLLNFLEAMRRKEKGEDFDAVTVDQCWANTALFEPFMKIK